MSIKRISIILLVLVGSISLLAPVSRNYHEGNVKLLNGELPEVNITIAIQLIASPSHPTSYLENSSISAGEKVNVIARDKDSAWLLVRHKNLLGWIPAIISNPGVGSLNLNIVDTNLLESCSNFLGARNAFTDAWQIDNAGDLFIQGFVYISSNNNLNQDIVLVQKNQQGVKEYNADIYEINLDYGGRVIQFIKSIDEALQGDQFFVKINGDEANRVPIQVGFFTQGCDKTSASQSQIPGQISHTPKTPVPTIVIKVETSGGPVSRNTYDWSRCRASYTSRLWVGDRGYISFEPPYPNNIRNRPYIEGEKLGQIQPGEKLVVIKGPSCSNLWVWWKVTSLETGLTGWTAEGDVDNYWIIPTNE
jgi:hypothetical protein